MSELEDARRTIAELTTRNAVLEQQVELMRRGDFAGGPGRYLGHIQPGGNPALYGPDDVVVDGDWLASTERRLTHLLLAYPEHDENPADTLIEHDAQQTVRMLGTLIGDLIMIRTAADEPAEVQNRFPARMRTPELGMVAVTGADRTVIRWLEALRHQIEDGDHLWFLNR